MEAGLKLGHYPKGGEETFLPILPSLFWTLSVIGVAGQRVGANLLQLGS